MIKKIRTKFMIAAMGAVALVLALVLGLTNIINYKNTVEELDATLAILAENGGRFPQGPGQRPEFNIDINPETPFETRYFSVHLSEAGEVIDMDLENIAAIDSEEDAERIARWCRPINQGFYQNYRYIHSRTEQGVRIIFVDATRQIAQCRDFLLLSFSVALSGLLAVFVITYMLSNVIMRPIIRTQGNQRRFITNAGHDLKTPITIIDADAELLELEVGENEWLTDIRAQSRRLAALTEELIYLSKMEEDTKLAYIDFPISDMVEETTRSFAAPAKTKNRTITASITEGLSYTGDSGAIQKLISILLDNALKYSPEGSEITVSLKKRGRSVLLSVSNIAESLTREDTEHMFDRFYRSDSSRGSRGGFGIGLSVASAIVAAHKGRITAELDDKLLTITAIL